VTHFDYLLMIADEPYVIEYAVLATIAVTLERMNKSHKIYL